MHVGYIANSPPPLAVFSRPVASGDSRYLIGARRGGILNFCTAPIQKFQLLGAIIRVLFAHQPHCQERPQTFTKQVKPLQNKAYFV
jgi:hypothetical protein